MELEIQTIDCKEVRTGQTSLKRKRRLKILRTSCRADTLKCPSKSKKIRDTEVPDMDGIKTEVHKTQIMCRYLDEPGEPTRTYIYGSDGSFEVLEDNVRSVIVYTSDDSLAPVVEKGMRLLVDTAAKTYDGDDIYVFYQGKDRLIDIAKLVRCEDGSFSYISDYSHPKNLKTLDNLEFLGKVYEIQIKVPRLKLSDLNEKFTNKEDHSHV